MPPRPPPSAEGRFGKTPFAHVLLYIREHGLSGTLTVDGPAGGSLAGEHLFAFSEGMLAQAWIATSLDRLGDLLLELRVITRSQREDAEVMIAADDSVLVGEMYKSMGVLDDTTLEHVLREQLRRRALHIFTLGNAAYRFYEGCDLLQGFGGERFSEDILAIVWRGANQSPSYATMDAVLSKLGSAPMRLKAGAELDRFGFEPELDALLDLLRLDTVSVDEMTQSASDPQLARTLAYVLLVSKQVEPVARPSQPIMMRAATAPSIPALRVSAAPPAPPPAPVSAKVDDAASGDAKRVLAAMDDQSFFEMLEVPMDASAEAIKSSFVKLAAKWHPDRAPLQARELYQRVFSHLNEAHTTLSDDTMRARYTKVARDGGGSPASQRKVTATIDAATAAQKAEIHLRRREIDEAEKLAREGYALNEEDPAVLTVLGAVLLERNTDATLDEGIALLERTVVVAPKNDKAQVLLAMGYKRKQQFAKAIEHFKLAAAANPKNVDAAREVRLAEIRARGASAPPPKPSEPSPSGGLLSKLFKR